MTKRTELANAALALLRGICTSGLISPVAHGTTYCLVRETVAAWEAQEAAEQAAALTAAEDVTEPARRAYPALLS